MGFAQTAIDADDPYLERRCSAFDRRYGAGMGIHILIAAIGGAIGSSLRYLVSLGAARWVGTGFPLGTLLVNVVGCLIAGLIFGLAEERTGFSPIVRILLLTGFVGGFTTFSTFAVETVTLVQDGTWTLALLNFLANNLAGVTLAFAGIYMGRSI
jgi:CrcB protein